MNKRHAQDGLSGCSKVPRLEQPPDNLEKERFEDYDMNIWGDGTMSLYPIQGGPKTNEISLHTNRVVELFLTPIRESTHVLEWIDVFSDTVTWVECHGNHKDEVLRKLRPLGFNKMLNKSYPNGGFCKLRIWDGTEPCNWQDI